MDTNQLVGNIIDYHYEIYDCMIDESKT